MEEVLPMTVVKRLHQLQYEGLYVLLCELDVARVQEAHQVMIAVLKHQIERACWDRKKRNRGCGYQRHGYHHKWGTDYTVVLCDTDSL